MDRLRFNLNKATALCSTCSKSCPVKPAKEESDAIRYNARFLPQYWSSNKLLGLSSEGYRVPDELLPTCDAASSWERSWIFCCCWTSTSWIESRVCCSWLTVKNKQSKRRQSDSSLSFKKERTKKKRRTALCFMMKLFNWYKTTVFFPQWQNRWDSSHWSKRPSENCNQS